MKSINKVVVVASAAGALALSTAATASATVHTSHVDSSSQARIDFVLGSGTIDLPVRFQCWDPSGFGTIQAAVSQTATQSATGQAATGSSPIYTVNCDGKKRTIALNVLPQQGLVPLSGGGGVPNGFNLGRATAWAQLIAASGPAANTAKIKIVP